MRWSHPEMRVTVQQRWARGFWGGAPEKDE